MVWEALAVLPSQPLDESSVRKRAVPDGPDAVFGHLSW